MIAPKVVSLNVVIRDIEKMLRRLISEDIELVISLGESLWDCVVDPGQIGQVITNMLVNSRDAMPNGGKITIETFNITVEDDRKTEMRINTGDYIMLSISDTGIGMDEETQSHIFEPFFTTKGIGKGTGLGLSTCYGIVKQNNGDIYVSSTPGEGSTFTIYLPKVLTGDIFEESEEEVEEEIYDGTETILVVEDEMPVLNVLSKILEGSGYTVMTAEDGEQGMALAEQHGTGIDMLLTDVIMPRMSGKELSDQIKNRFPHMKILFMSGYTEDSIIHHGVLKDGVDFLSKPIQSTLLMKKIRELLDKV